MVIGNCTITIDRPREEETMSALTGLIIVMAIATVIVALCFMQDAGLLRRPARVRERDRH